MGSFLSSSNISKEDIQMALDKVKRIVSSTPVVVFSKTYCGYCNRVKQLLTQLGASYKTIELDEESDGGEMQAALTEWTGQRTVPNVFIGGTHIGGCDCKPNFASSIICLFVDCYQAVMAKHQAGQLVNLLTDAGANAITVSLNA